MRTQRTHYEILGLDLTASPGEIKLRYYDLARKYHPDRARDNPSAERIFMQINIAYRTLMDANKRAIYDSSLVALRSASRNGCGPASQHRPGGPPSPPVVNVEETLAKAHSAYLGADRAGARVACMAVLGADPANREAHALLGDIYADQGRRQEALDEYKAAAAFGRPSFMLQQKITRMESLIANPSAAPKPSPPPSTASCNDTQAKRSILAGFLGGRSR